MKNKICCKCSLIKDITLFNKNSRAKDGLDSKCRECAKKAQVTHYNNNGRTKATLWKEKNPDKVKNSRLLSKYGITLEQYNEIIQEQQEACAACGNAGKLCVDHDHSTGAVRGMLCSNCNRALGLLKDSIPVLEQMVIYLRKSL